MLPMKGEYKQSRLFATASLPQRTGRRPPPIYCAYAGCETSTSENKPYCSSHVGCLEYYSTVNKKHESALEELARVVQRETEPWKEVDVNGVIARDVLSMVWEQPRTPASIKRSLHYCEGLEDAEVTKVAQAYLCALEEMGLVHSRPTVNSTVYGYVIRS